MSRSFIMNVNDRNRKYEPILHDNENRYVIYPIKYNRTWEMYKKAIASFWTAEEIDLSKDANDWESLKPEEQFFIKN